MPVTWLAERGIRRSDFDDVGDDAPDAGRVAVLDPLEVSIHREGR